MKEILQNWKYSTMHLRVILQREMHVDLTKYPTKYLLMISIETQTLSETKPTKLIYSLV